MGPRAGKSSLQVAMWAITKTQKGEPALSFALQAGDLGLSVDFNRTGLPQQGKIA